MIISLSSHVLFCNVMSCFLYVVACAIISYVMCGRDEGVQGVLTLFCSGAAQVCHDDRVVDLKEQLEVEEEDGDRQEEEEEVESGEASQGECAMWMTVDECENALRT